MTIGEYLFHGVFFVLVFGVPIYLALASYSERCSINVSSLWTSHATGKVDTMLVIVLGTWWVHTCGVILWILTQKLNDSNVTQYMGWALPIIASWFAHRGDKPKQEA